VPTGKNSVDTLFRMEMWNCHVLEQVLVLRSLNVTRHVLHLKEKELDGHGAGSEKE
jgi:hypothetical protein